VVLAADHGHHLGEHGGLWRKDTLFEEALRAPLIVVAPQVQQPGVPAERPVEYLDVYPTIAELAGLPLPRGLDGASLLPDLASPGQPSSKPALSFRRAPAPPLGATVRTERFRYTEWPDGSEELYDHLDDPGETRNLAGTRGREDTRDTLRKLLEEAYRPMKPS
jgi:arylsulfatase A-like enzyme